MFRQQQAFPLLYLASPKKTIYRRRYSRCIVFIVLKRLIYVNILAFFREIARSVSAGDGPGVFGLSVDPSFPHIIVPKPLSQSTISFVPGFRLCKKGFEEAS